MKISRRELRKLIIESFEERVWPSDLPRELYDPNDPRPLWMDGDKHQGKHDAYYRASAELNGYSPGGKKIELFTKYSNSGEARYFLCVNDYDWYHVDAHFAHGISGTPNPNNPRGLTFDPKKVLAMTVDNPKWLSKQIKATPDVLNAYGIKVTPGFR